MFYDSETHRHNDTIHPTRQFKYIIRGENGQYSVLFVPVLAGAFSAVTRTQSNKNYIFSECKLFLLIRCHTVQLADDQALKHEPHCTSYSPPSALSHYSLYNTTGMHFFALYALWKSTITLHTMGSFCIDLLFFVVCGPHQ